MEERVVIVAAVIHDVAPPLPQPSSDCPLLLLADSHAPRIVSLAVIVPPRSSASATSDARSPPRALRACATYLACLARSLALFGRNMYVPPRFC